MSSTSSIPSKSKVGRNKISERMFKSDVPSEARMYCVSHPTKYWTLCGKLYGKYREVKRHVKDVHGFSVGNKCKRCDWSCFDLLDGFLAHGKNVHQIVWNGKATKCSLRDHLFEWVGFETKPSKKYAPICDEGREKRKKAISKGTKQRSRLTAATAKMLNDWATYEMEKHHNVSGDRLQLLIARRNKILAKNKVLDANFLLVYKLKETKVNPSPIENNSEEVVINIGDEGGVEILEVSFKGIGLLVSFKLLNMLVILRRKNVL